MYQEILEKKENCPHCGKKEGAIMSSNKWGHSITCCSEWCGQMISGKIQTLKASKEMIKLQNKLDKTRKEIITLFEKEIKTKMSCFDIDNWL